MKRAGVLALGNLVRVLLVFGGGLIFIKWGDVNGPDLFIYGVLTGCVAMVVGCAVDEIVDGAMERRARG